MDHAIAPRSFVNTSAGFENASSREADSKAALLDGTSAVHTFASKVSKRMSRRVPIIGRTKVIFVVQVRTLLKQLFDGP